MVVMSAHKWPENSKIMRIPFVGLVTIYLFLASASLSYAQSQDSETEASICENCIKNKSHWYDNVAAIRAIKDQLPGLPGIGQVFNHKCENFISSDGLRGVWGDRIIQAIEDINPKCFYEDMDVSRLCPKFESFSQGMKEHFWIWVFASIAQKESSCQTNSQAPGPYGTADGLFQLEYEVSLRRRSERDSKWCKTKSSIKTQGIDFQMECATSIFNDINCKRGQRLSYEGGYWERLRGSNLSISNLIKRFKPCR